MVLHAGVLRLRLSIRRMTMLSLVLAALISLGRFQAAAVSASVPGQPTAQLGELEIKATRVEGQMIISDSFTGPSRHTDRITINVRIKNVGNSIVCAELNPSIEEYKGLELWRVDPVKKEYIRVPQVRNLAPGKTISGSYVFEPEPVKRKYILVVEQKSRNQNCRERQKDQATAVSTPLVVRIPLESIEHK
jgi:hypothetical protein